MKILLVDDDDQLTQLVTKVLTAQNYTVEVARDGLTGWQLTEASPYDVILLDVMLPQLDGISFCRRLRSQQNTTPVILLTARDTGTDKLTGLDAGADDYLVKPLDVQELLARIRAVLRRGQEQRSEPVLEWGNLRLNPVSLEVVYGNTPLKLRRKEFAILELFLRNRHRIFSRSAILDRLWSIDETPNEETVKAHIKAIRQQLRTVGASDLIETLYGQGYRLNTAYETPKATTPILLPGIGVPSTAPSPIQATQAAIAQVWQQTKGLSFDRLTVIEQASDALQADCLTEELRQQAESAAHKLLGALGTFGFHQASPLAQQLEQWFSSGTTVALVDPAKITTTVAQLRHQLAIPQDSPLPVVAADLPELPQILLVDNDLALLKALQGYQGSSGWQITLAPSLGEARIYLAQRAIAVVVLNLGLDPHNRLLTELAAQTNPIPVVVIAEYGFVADRVMVARLGGRFFLPKPIRVEEVHQAISQILQSQSYAEATILAVDDDRQLLAAMQALLEPWGLALTCVEHPEDFWPALEATRPDLIILDIEMPGIDGFELCQMIRSDPQWNWIPIIFLTASIDGSVMYRVFELGADDYVNKPIVAPVLLNRLLNRLERTKLLRSYANIDPTTGIANRQQGSQAIEQQLRFASRSRQAVCLAVITVDRLKLINQQSDYATGDKVLRWVVRQLQLCLRPEDILIRWSGAELVVSIVGFSGQDGVEWVAGVIETLRSLPITRPDGDSLYVTISAGVASYPDHGDQLFLLYRGAEAAMHQAISQGGDRVFATGWQATAPIQLGLLCPPDDWTAQLGQALDTRGYHYQQFTEADTAIATLTQASRSPTSPLAQRFILVISSPADADSLAILERLDSTLLSRYRPMVVLTDAHHAETAKALGAFDYLVKPCSPTIALQTLRRALETS